MHAYAQTNIQLYRQLAERGYVEADIDTVARAYEMSLRLLSGTFRGSGKPFLSHLVGTASILGSLRTRAPVVAAGLLHASYSHGEFGNGWRGMFPARRMEIRRAIGEGIENLVAQYTELPWHAGTIGEIRGRIESLTAAERDVLLIRLANELEDHLDLGILYLGDAERRREHMRTHLTSCVDMAERLGFPELAAALTAAFADLEKAEVPVSLRRSEDASFLVPPASHRTRLRVVASHLIARVRPRLRQRRPR
jgi:(p)ppGpp synthase/HD superfamily hydrolase